MMQLLMMVIFPTILIKENLGITVCEKQRLLKDFRIIEILTEIIYYPFKLGDNPINLKDINNSNFQTVRIHSLFL